MSNVDAFVRCILDDSPTPRIIETDNSAQLSRELLRGESMRTIPEGSPHKQYSATESRITSESVSNPNSQPLFLSGTAGDSESSVLKQSLTSTARSRDESPLLLGSPGASKMERLERAQSLFRYSLIFINFTFIVAAMLLIMAGVVARENQAVKLCDHCGDLTLVAIVFGITLWLFAIFGFNWIRQRNILLLLVYVAFLVLQTITLLGVIITAGVFDANTNALTETSLSGSSAVFLDQWIENVNMSYSNPSVRSYLCDLQLQFNCSGYYLGCCTEGVCYNTSTIPGVPAWVSQVCPYCPNQTATPVKCTGIVYDTLRKNLGGFLVISCFSMLLIISGMLLAFLARKVNQGSPQ